MEISQETDSKDGHFGANHFATQTHPQGVPSNPWKMHAMATLQENVSYNHFLKNFIFPFHFASSLKSIHTVFPTKTEKETLI